MEDNVSEAKQLAQWLTGKWISHAICTAAKLSIADLLHEGGQTIQELAAKSGAHPPSLYRLLRALASLGIFRETAPRYFESTSFGALLTLGEVKSACLMMHSHWHDRAWGELLYSVQTGRSGFAKAHGLPLFDWLAQHPDDQGHFDAAMTAGKTYRNQGIDEHYDFTPFESIVDVGGGQGSLVTLLLERYPHLNAKIADRPQTLEAARTALTGAGLAARCQFIATDFFAGVPPRGDVYILAHIMHDWSDEDCRTILTNCRVAMRPNSRLLLIEGLLTDSGQPDRLPWIDLEMLVLTEGGRERTLNEYRELLSASGLEMLRAISTGGTRSIIEAKRYSGYLDEKAL